MQVDNWVGENKNHILVGYLGSHLGRGIIICRVENQFPNGGTRAHQDRSDLLKVRYFVHYCNDGRSRAEVFVFELKFSSFGKFIIPSKSL